MKAIITGINGQDGFYLSELLKKNEVDVIAAGRKDMDISDFQKVQELIIHHQPDYIFHLAANSTTQHSALFENNLVIGTVTLYILEAVKLFSPQTKVFISGSGLQFKNEGRPIRESDPFEARDAYSISRIQSVYAARYYRSLGIQTYVGYFFNHDSPRRSEKHMAKKISAFAQRIAKGDTGTLEIGDMSVVKEWTFAGDVVEGVWKFVNQENIFEANISSGIGYSITDWVNACFQVIGKNPAGYIREADGFKAEYRQLVSNPALIQQIGFFPKISFQELAKMMVLEP